jgi:hypothetical protein
MKTTTWRPITQTSVAIDKNGTECASACQLEDSARRAACQSGCQSGVCGAIRTVYENFLIFVSLDFHVGVLYFLVNAR